MTTEKVREKVNYAATLLIPVGLIMAIYNFSGITDATKKLTKEEKHKKQKNGLIGVGLVVLGFIGNRKI